MGCYRTDEFGNCQVLQEVVDGVKAIVIDSWPIIVIYLFDEPQKVEILTKNDLDWGCNDQYTVFKFGDTETSIEEPMFGEVFEKPDDVDKYAELEKYNFIIEDFADCPEDEDFDCHGILIDDDYDPRLGQYIRNGYNFARQVKPKNVKELLKELTKLGKVIYSVGN